MKTKITLKNFLKNAVIAFIILFGFHAKAQTYVYNETTSSGIFFWQDGSVVSNPVSDAVNSSANCVVSGTVQTWSQIQLFPNPKYTPATGDKLYFSIYDPNNVGKAQIKFEYTGSSAWVDGGDVTYVSGTNTGWQEQSISLTPNVGNEISKIIIMPGYNTSSVVYIDNIYFGQTSVLATQNTIVYDETTNSGMWFQGTTGGEVVNPLTGDAVNSSPNVAKSATDAAWQQIQYFPTYTPASGEKLFFSVYDPSNAGKAQIKFEYTGSSAWVDGGDVTYVSGTNTGWQEQSISLTPNAGNEISKIIIMPGYDTASAVYIDNIYFGTTSTLPVPQNPIVYDETTNSGMWFQGTNGAEVVNPLTGDPVNSSVNVAKSATDAAWQQIQYFPTYTPVSGEKLFFSVYDPSNAGKAQIKFEYTGSSAWVDGGDVTYVAGTDTGWKEQSISLAPNAGNEISKVIIMPGYDTSSAVYIDNIYFGASSTLSANSVAQINNRVYISREGSIQFNKAQTNTLLSVYDLMGRLILEEKINGKKGEKVLNHKGIYILRVKSVNGINSQKIALY
jgi:archaellum component FlaG (FlaF/FlaG flagellin family)